MHVRIFEGLFVGRFVHVTEWYCQGVIVLSQIVGLCVLGRRVGMLGTGWLNLDDELMLNVLRCQLTY